MRITGGIVRRTNLDQVFSQKKINEEHTKVIHLKNKKFLYFKEAYKIEVLKKFEFNKESLAMSAELWQILAGKFSEQFEIKTGDDLSPFLFSCDFEDESG